jgi:hypothetical protein
VSERDARGVRLLRAVLATLVVIGLASSAHQAGGGPSLRAVPALVLAAVVGPLVWAIVRRHASMPRMALAAAAGQVVTHVLLAGMAPNSGGTASAVHLHDTLSPHLQGPAPTMTSHASGSMLVAHAVATVLAALVLTAGDDVARTAVRRLLTGTSSPTVVLSRLVLPVEWTLRPVSGRELRPFGGRAPPTSCC